MPSWDRVKTFTLTSNGFPRSCKKLTFPAANGCFDFQEKLWRHPQKRQPPFSRAQARARIATQIHTHPTVSLRPPVFGFSGFNSASGSPPLCSSLVHPIPTSRVSLPPNGLTLARVSRLFICEAHGRGCTGSAQWNCRYHQVRKVCGRRCGCFKPWQMYYFLYKFTTFTSNSTWLVWPVWPPAVWIVGLPF